MKFVTVKYIKSYFKEKGLNTSVGVVDQVNKHLENVFNKAEAEAKKNGRKTVMDRDIVSAIVTEN